MGGFFSEPIVPQLDSTTTTYQNIPLITKKYKTKRKIARRSAFDIFERPTGSLDTIHEHDNEMIQPDTSPQGTDTNEIIYDNHMLEQIQDISKQEFYQSKKIDLQPVIITDDIILKKHKRNS